MLEGRYAPLRARVKEVLARPEFASRPGLDRTEYRQQVLRWTRMLADHGFGAVGYPEASGGGGDPGALAAVAGVLGLGDLSLFVKFGVQFGLFGGAIAMLGTERHHRQYLTQAASMELVGCFAMTETDHGSNVRGLETRAVYDPDREEFEITTPHDGARKDYVGNAALHARMAVVFAQLESRGTGHGVHAFLVPLRDEAGRELPGIRIEDCGEKLGLNGVDNGRIWFDRMRIPRENLLDRFATVSADGSYDSPIESDARRFFTMIGTLVSGRVSVAEASVSAAQTALAIAIRYGERRRQFAPEGEAEMPLLDYLTHQRRLMPRLATTYAFALATQRLLGRFMGIEGAEERRRVETLAAGLKAAGSWHALDSIQACREACGGAGYLAVNRFAALRADVDAFTTFEGDNTVLMQLVTRSLLAEYRQEFEDLDLWGVIRHLAGQAAGVIGEIDLVASRKADVEHLRDRAFHLETFRWREHHMLSALARRLKRRIDQGMDPHLAYTECQDHVVATARAHVERVVLEAFSDTIDQVEEPELREALVLLADLYALWHIQQDRGWFQEHGHLSSSKAKAIRKMVNRLCGKVREQAIPLVEAFAIPDALLAAPIALT